MKNIFKTLFVTAASVSLLTGCIKETFPLEGAATSEQLAQSAAGMAASVDGLVAQTYQPYYFYGSSNQQEFDISYVKQCREGERLRFYRKKQEDGVYLVQGINGDNECVLRAKIRFENAFDDGVSV